MHATLNTMETMESSAIAEHGATRCGNHAGNDLPQPQNANHISVAPLKEKLLTNSSYLAAEIPLKLGHWVSNLWHPSTSHQQQQGADAVWLLGCQYSLPQASVLKMQQEIIRAQSERMFDPTWVEGQDDEQEAGNNTPSFALSNMWPPDFYADFTSRLWMRYRYNYPPIRPSHYKTDIGWGCMLRSGQALLGNALLIHFLGRDWRRLGPEDPSWKEYRKIVHWFLDELSPRAPFSIHRIALLGKQLGKNIGEWFGPSTISQVILALVSDFPPAQMAVYIATDGVVYKEDVADVALGKKPRGEFGYLSSRSRQEDEESEETRALYKSSNVQDSDTESDQIPRRAPNTFKSVLVLVAIRLGIDKLHPTYHPALKACFQLPWCVGIAGGRPNSSLYFIGLQGDELIYLDPHFSQAALETKSLNDYDDADLSTYHCDIPRKINIASLDPSMLLGFYCRTEDDFDAFCDSISQIAAVHTAIFTIEKKRAPEYDEDVRSENDFGVVSDEEEQEEGEESGLDEPPIV